VRRAIFAAGWRDAPAGLTLREFALLPLAVSPRSWRSARFWAGAALDLDVELSASVLVLREEAAGRRRAAALPGSMEGLFRSWVTASDDAALRRAALAADRAAQRSRVLTDFTAAAARCDAARRAGRAIVFTNGVFDMLHLGHVRLLQAASSLGAFLVVGINSDSSARRLKGRSRPVVPQFARAELVAAVRGVDLCVLFDQPDPAALLRAVRPAVLAKGSEYSLAGVAGRRFVESTGGRVVLVPHVEGWSATKILRRIRGRGA